MGSGRPLCIYLSVSYVFECRRVTTVGNVLTWGSSDFLILCGLSATLAVAFPGQFSNPYNDFVSN